MPIAIVFLYLATVLVRLGLTLQNVRHRRLSGDKVPSEFSDSIDTATLKKMSAYQADRESFGLIQLLVSTPIVIGFLFGGGLSAYDRWLGGLVHAGIGHGVLFFLGLLFASSILELPFDAYTTFRIEQRHGFNRTTPGLFLADWCKSTLLGMLLVAGIAAAGLTLYRAAPEWYWLWFWVFGMTFAVLLMLITPSVIEPLFIKTSPLGNLALADAVRELGSRVGVEVNRVVQVDASKRSSHSNAYFTGIGRVKRVVLFDTLLERLSEAEVLAVLGHELGHWKLRHITQRLVSVALFALAILYVASRCLAWQEFSLWVGLPGASLPAQVVMLLFLQQIAGFFLSPVSAWSSRRHEWQADSFASQLTGRGQDLASALVKLASDNLTNLHPHPWYAAFYHSHPPAAERVRKLRESDVAV